MRFGLEEHIVESIISVFEEHSKVDKAYVFGSRAKGNYRPDSDIDIAIKGQELTTDDIISMAVAFEAEGVTYKIDLIDYNNIKEPELRNHIDRVGIEFYSRWKEYTLGEITHKITDGAHLSPKDYPNGKIMFSVKDMTETGFDYSSPKTISQEDFDNLIKQGCQPDIDDVLIAKDGSVLKHIFRVTTKPDYVLLSSIAIVKPKKEIVDASFLVYTLKNPKITETILNNFVSGSGVPRIVLKDFKKVNISLPPLSEQRAISSILSSLDDKIDLLQRQNKTLEQLAETLFRQWFIEDADESWKIDKLGNYANTVDNRGKTPPNSEIETQFPLIEANAINGDERLINYSVIKKYVSEDTFNNWFRNKLSKYDTVITTVGANIGAMAMYVLERGNIAQNIIGLSAHGISPFFLYQMLKYKGDEILLMDIGGVQPSLKVPHLLSLEIPIPPDKLQDEFDIQILEFVSKMEANYNQIITITHTREALLPKLLSGEVRALESSPVKL